MSHCSGGLSACNTPKSHGIVYGKVSVAAHGHCGMDTGAQSLSPQTMKRRRDDDHDEAQTQAPARRDNPFPFEALLPEMRGEVRGHLDAMGRHVLKLTSRGMLREDIDAPATPAHLVHLAAYFTREPDARRPLVALGLLFWGEELKQGVMRTWFLRPVSWGLGVAANAHPAELMQGGPMREQFIRPGRLVTWYLGVNNDTHTFRVRLTHHLVGGPVLRICRYSTRIVAATRSGVTWQSGHDNMAEFPATPARMAALQRLLATERHGEKIDMESLLLA
jgi:hypothetical protein